MGLTAEITSTVDKPVLDIIASRRSLRAFADSLLSQVQIDTLFEAARWAPSSVNEQPWRYLYATRNLPLWQTILETLNEGNQVWAKHAPLLVVSMLVKNYSKTGRPNATASYDLGAANAFLSLQATAMGLNVHQMGGYNRESLRERLNIPAEYDPTVILAIGYPGDPEELPEPLRLRELAPRLRKTRATFVMNESF